MIHGCCRPEDLPGKGKGCRAWKSLRGGGACSMGMSMKYEVCSMDVHFDVSRNGNEN